MDYDHFVASASDEEILGFFRGVNKTLSQLEHHNGYRLVANQGRYGGQLVPHFHMHILSGKQLSGVA